MRLHSVLFASQNTANYERMAEVLRISSGENTPNTPLTIHRVDEADNDVAQLARQGCKRTWIDNARKAKHHRQIIHDAKDGELLGMLDVDTMVLGDLSEIESMDFDLAYTVRPPGSKWKLNTGVYFVRVSARMREFCRQWCEKTLEMLTDGALHKEWKKQKAYGGTHQAAFGWMTENSGLDFGTLSLPCEIWNCVNGCYETAENPKVVHLMQGSMRKWCLDGRKASNANAQRLADRWKEYDGVLCQTR